MVYAFPVPPSPMKPKSPKKATASASPTKKSKQSTSALTPSFPRSPSIPSVLKDDKPVSTTGTPKAGVKRKKREHQRTPSDSVSTNTSTAYSTSSSRAATPGADAEESDFFGSLAKEDSSSTLTTSTNFYASLARSLSDKGFTTAREGSLTSSTSSIESVEQAKLPICRPKSRVDGSPAENIRVVIRVRPSQKANSTKTWTCQDTGVIKLSSNDPHVKSKGPSLSSEAYTFHFDAVLGPQGTTQALYQGNLSAIVQAAIEGYNATIFAYGQTGSGKTHTMIGTDTEMGIVQNAIDDVFQHIESETSRTFLLRVSYLECYNEQLHDLLSPSSTKLEIRENKKSGIYVDPLKEKVVSSPAEVYQALEEGKANRHVAATDWNARSSRSHCIFTLTIESAPRLDATREANADTLSMDTRISQLNLIDLAGSERMSSTAANERNAEGSAINKSLLALGNVIAKLSTPGPKGHVPYRDSRLTRLLQTSLSGNARIAIICTISSEAEQVSESLSTLKFARNAKLVVTRAERGTAASNDSALLQRYRKEIEDLRARLDDQNRNIADAQASEEVEEERRKLGQLADERLKAESEIADMRQRRTQLSNELEHLQKLLLTGSETKAEDLHAMAGYTNSSARHAYYRRVSAMGNVGPTGLSAIPTFAKRSISTNLEATAGPQTISAERAIELERQISKLHEDLRAKDGKLFQAQTQAKELQAQLDFAKEDLQSASVQQTSLSETQKESLGHQEVIANLNLEIARLRSDASHKQQLDGEPKEQDSGLANELPKAKELASQYKSECASLQSKIKATAMLMSNLQESRDAADKRIEEVHAELNAANASIAKLRKSEAQLQKQVLGERERANKYKNEREESRRQLEAQSRELDVSQKMAIKLQGDLDAQKLELDKAESEVTRVRDLRRPQLPHTIYGPTANDLAARVTALSSSSSRNSRGPSNGRTTPSISASDHNRELQDTIAGLKKRIVQLEVQADSANTRSTPNGLEASAYREELIRVNQVLEEQKESIAGYKADILIWQQRVADQTKLIQKLEKEGISNSQGSSAPRSLTPPPQNVYEDRVYTPTRRAKPGLYDFDATSSPRALSQDLANFQINESSPSRKNRRLTIEGDIEKLESNKVVERSRSILMTPRAAMQKKRVLTGINERVAQRALGVENAPTHERQVNNSNADREWYV